MIEHAPTQAARLHLESRLVVLHCYAHGNNVGKIVKALEPISRTFHNFGNVALGQSCLKLAGAACTPRNHWLALWRQG